MFTTANPCENQEHPSIFNLKTTPYKETRKANYFPTPKPPKHVEETISVGFKQCKLVGKFQHKALCADVKHKGSTRLTPLGFQATLP